MDAQASAEAVERASGVEIPLPDGEYAIVEIMGHRTLIGRVTEVERFGATMMSLEPVLAGNLLPAVLINGSSIYQFTPCSAAIAMDRAPKESWQLPSSISCVLPPAMIEARPVYDGNGRAEDGEFSEIDDEDDVFPDFLDRPAR